MPRESGKRRVNTKPEDERLLLEQIREANPSAVTQYLEYLIIQRRSVVSILTFCKPVPFHAHDGRNG